MKIKWLSKLLIVTGFWLLVANSVFSKDISVTRVKVTGNQAEIVVNDVLVIKEIRVDRDGGMSLRFPEFVSRTGKIYPQMKLLLKQADDAIRKAIKTEKPSLSKIEWDFKNDLKLVKLEKHKTKGLYFGTVTFGDAIEVSCKFSRRAEKVKVSWPARPPAIKSARWVNQIYFKRRELRQRAEAVLVEQFIEKEKELSAGSDAKRKGDLKKEQKPKAAAMEGDE